MPAVIIDSAASLPRLDQVWAWAHVQVDGFDPATEQLADVVHNQPRRVRARLLAPRLLAPRTAYTALLVPTFERGRRAGLREPVTDDVAGTLPAWAPDATRVRLPVYFRWSFATGEEGDFEALAQRLVARHGRRLDRPTRPRRERTRPGAARRGVAPARNGGRAALAGGRARAVAARTSAPRSSTRSPRC